MVVVVVVGDFPGGFFAENRLVWELLVISDPLDKR